MTRLISRVFRLNGAAQESNLPSRGLHGRTGVEDAPVPLNRSGRATARQPARDSAQASSSPGSRPWRTILLGREQAFSGLDVLRYREAKATVANDSLIGPVVSGTYPVTFLRKATPNLKCTYGTIGSCCMSSRLARW
jgi:hypothetical protein